MPRRSQWAGNDEMWEHAANLVHGGMTYRDVETQLSKPELIGTMLTVQTSIGFLLTIVTIQLTPFIVDLTGWRYGFAYLAIGPAIGIMAMLRLRQLPDALKLAGGRR